jgi:hypothetical protein
MGDHKQPGELRGDAMPFSDIIVNGHSVAIFRYVSNSLTPEACRTYGMEGVDIDVVHTDLAALALDDVPANTYGLVHYLPERLDLARPVSSSIGLRLMHLDPGGTEVQAVTYDGSRYSPQPYRISLAGSMGCTATMYLGFFLLNRVQEINTRVLGMLFLFDRDRLRQRLKLNLPVDDEPIMQFCKEQGFTLTAAVDQPDCNKWRGCKNQEGRKCDVEWDECRYSTS